MFAPQTISIVRLLVNGAIRLLLQPGSDGPVSESDSPLDWPLPIAIGADSVERMMAYDTLNYLPNDILTKVDRLPWLQVWKLVHPSLTTEWLISPGAYRCH